MSITTTRGSSPIEQIRNQLTTMTTEFKNALPSHIKPERFQRVVMTVVQQTPDLITADRRSLFAACLKCASDGLIPDGREAALVLFKGRVQYFPMFAGIQKRIRNSDEVASVQAHVIYEHDHFVIRRGMDETIEHIPLFPGDRGKAVGAYAIAKFKDGSDPVFEVMDVNEIEKIRSISPSKNSGPWVQHWDQMARKSVFRRLAKWLPMDADVDDLMKRDDAVPSVDASIHSLESHPVQQDPFEAASQGVSVSVDGEILPQEQEEEAA